MSDNLLTSHDELDELKYPLSQTAAAEFRGMQFHVEEFHANRIDEFKTLLRHFRTTQGDPTALWTRIRSWNNRSNEQ